MAGSSTGDIARQLAVLVTAVTQIAFSATIGQEVGRVAQQNRSVIIPATYAFAIWGLIFLLCLVYGVYQALPAQRQSPLFRAVGWWSAGAFLCNTLWNPVYVADHLTLAQGIMLIGVLCAGRAFQQFTQRAGATDLAPAEQWVVAPALGMLFGWLLAANIVGLASTLIRHGFAATGDGAVIGGAALLLLGGGIAFWVILFSRRGPSTAWGVFGLTISWALVAVLVEHRETSPLIVAAAAAGCVLVVAAMAGPWGGPAARASSRV